VNQSNRIEAMPLSARNTKPGEEVPKNSVCLLHSVKVTFLEIGSLRVMVIRCR